MALHIIAQASWPTARGRSQAAGLVLVLLVGATVAGCAGSTGKLSGSAAMDPGRPRADAIGGTVWVDTDGDGQHSADEATGPGTTLSLWLDTNGDGICGANDQQVASATAGEDGTYLFENLAAGRYCVAVGTGAAVTWSEPVDLVTGQGQTLDLALP